MPLRNQQQKLRVQVTRHWIEEVLAFANFENLGDTQTPTMLRTVDDVELDLGVAAQGTRLDPESDYVLPEFTGVLRHEGLGDSQSRLREVLDSLAAHGATSEVNQLINDSIGGAGWDGAITYREGYLQFLPSNIQSLDQWWTICIATLCDTGLGDRVRQCGWDKCAKYFVDWPGRKGQMKYYCCPEHQNAERQRRFRDRAKERRKKRNTPGLGGAI